MKLLFPLFVLMLFLGSCENPSNESSKIEIPKEVNNPFEKSSQLVVVRSSSDTMIIDTLQKYEKLNGEWKESAKPHPITLGKTGLAWGSGVHKMKSDYSKKEGDGKSLAGIFTFGTAFGYAPKKEVDFLKLDYVPLTEITQCIEDSGSKYYNQIVNDEAIKSDWNSTDFMLRKDDLYKWGVFVNHNTPAKAQNGSCIFFHLWRGPDRYTAGCTAMTEENILSLIKWLDPAKNPMLIQVTEKDYKTYQQEYKLP